MFDYTPYWPETVTSQDCSNGCALTFLARDRLSSRDACDVASPPAPADVPIGADAGGFFELRARVERLQERADALAKTKGRRGYPAMLERLRTARTALMRAENARD